MKIKAYPYVRFSSTAQESGDSIRRQKGLINGFIKKHNLELDESLELNDYGTSAFRGANIIEGDLGKFIALVEARKIDKGSFLLIENFDRFSRMQPRKALSPFLKLLDAGINIATLDDDKIYGSELGTMELLGTIFSMERAHEESARKGRLVSAAKRRAKQDVIDGKRKTLWKWGTPKWLNLSPDKSEYLIIEDRVKLIKRILQWVKDGYGMGSIVRKIEAEGIAPWGSSSGIDITKKKSKCWYNSQISRIVNNRALIGELELKQKDSKGNALPSQIVKDFFPKIISEEDFLRVQNAIYSRKVSGTKGGGRKGKAYSNLFSKLIMCGYSLEKENIAKFKCEGDNQYMVYSNNDKRDPKSKKIWRQRYLKCAYAKANASRCKKCRKYIQYDFFELAFLEHVNDIAADDIFGNSDEKNQERESIIRQLEVCNAKMQNARKTLEEFSKLLDRGGAISDLFNQKAIKCEEILRIESEKIKKLELNLSDYDENSSDKADFTHTLKSLIDAQADCTNDRELFDMREKISNLLKTAIDKIELYVSGNLMSDKAINLVPVNVRDKVQKLFRQNESQLQGVANLCVVVIHYRSGKERQMLLNTTAKAKDALVAMTSLDGDKFERWIKGWDVPPKQTS